MSFQTAALHGLIDYTQPVFSIAFELNEQLIACDDFRYIQESIRIITMEYCEFMTLIAVSIILSQYSIDTRNIDSATCY